MLNNIREIRAVNNGQHDIILEIPEEIYKNLHINVNDIHGNDILKKYLKYHQDDARISNVKMEHNKSTKTVNIYANLHYLGNKKTY